MLAASIPNCSIDCSLAVNEAISVAVSPLKLYVQRMYASYALNTVGNLDGAAVGD